MDESRLKALVDEASAELSGRSDFSFSEAWDSLMRGYQHYLDLGESEDAAWDHALELVAFSAERARRSGWGLLGVVNHLLFSQHHRVQSRFGV